ncbi:MAG: M20 family metallopeptidase [Chloroflexota bacterium]
MGIDELKANIIKEVGARRGELTKLSKIIHENPEEGRCETKAASWLSSYLEHNGFRLERGLAELPTAFAARYGEGHPVIAFLAEYDALPGLGHACGHNIIAASAAGAAVASMLAVKQFGGTIVVIGTPDEEKGAGKAVLVDSGVFDGIDAAMMVHPGGYDMATMKTLACQTVALEFFGKEAHAAASPELGINALEAMLLSFAAVNSLRQHIREKARIHGIITDGGRAANIVPGHSAGNFMVRAEDDGYLEELKQKVINCFVGAGSATGARLEYRWDDAPYRTMKSNLTVARLFQDNMKSLGRDVILTDPEKSFFSTDMGNVSQVVPAIHAMVAIAPTGVSLHTPAFADASVSAAGTKGLIDGAGALAMTAADLLAGKEIMTGVKEEFFEQK